MSVREADHEEPRVLQVDAVDRIPDVLHSAAVPRGRPVLVLVGGG